MKFRPVLFGLLAGVAGIVLLVVYMRKFEEEASGGRKIALLVAVSPIVRSKPINADMLGTREVPAAYVDDRSIRASDKDKIIGLRATTNVPVEQSISWMDVIAMADDARELASLVQPGYRAMPIRVAFEEEIPLVRPGDFVDVLGVFNDTHETSVLLQRVLVLASGTETGHQAPTEKRLLGSKTLTLSVSLQQSQLLALAMQRGVLTVIIRSPDDQNVSETPPDLSANVFTDLQKRQVIQSPRRAVAGPLRLQAEPVPR